MKYKYQLHTHTAPTSKCAHTTPEQLAEALHAAGYAGCVLTNHFLHGNTGIRRELPWEEFVAAYERDYIECKAAAEKYGLDILFGIEEGVEGYDEILCYGLTPEMLYAHPELRECSAETWYRVMHAMDVLVIQAHPYRASRHVPDPVPLPRAVIDGIEVYNDSHSPEYNEKAVRFAASHKDLILTAGADTHDAATVGRGGIATDIRVADSRALCALLRIGRYELLTP